MRFASTSAVLDNNVGRLMTSLVNISQAAVSPTGSRDLTGRKEHQHALVSLSLLWIRLLFASGHLQHSTFIDISSRRTRKVLIDKGGSEPGLDGAALLRLLDQAHCSDGPGELQQLDPQPQPCPAPSSCLMPVHLNGKQVTMHSGSTS